VGEGVGGEQVLQRDGKRHDPWHIGTRLGLGFSFIGDRGKEIGTGDSLPLMSQPGWPLVSDDGSQKETMALVGKIDFLEVGLHEEIAVSHF